MTEPKTIQDYQKAIDEKKMDLLEKFNEVLAFVDTDHKAKRTKEYQKEIHQLASEINTFIIGLIKAKETAEGHAKDVSQLCADGEKLAALNKDIATALAADLQDRQKEEEIDVIKVASFAATLALLSVTISRYAFDHNSSHAALEATVGATTGVAISFHKKLSKGFVHAMKALCCAPVKAKNSFALYYIKESAKDLGREISRPIRNEKSFLLPTGNNYEQRKQNG